MIAPLLQYTIKGAIWYQGESNVGRAKQYSKTFPLMIENWRKEWQLGNFPFYFVQIAPFQYESGTNSAPLRDAQRLSLRTPNTGMAVTLDIGDINNIHPANKKDVGERLALWALAKDYGESIVYSGPLYHQMKVENSLLRISFTHIGSGLMINGTTLKEFEIAGEDGIFYPAKATVNNNVVILQCEKVKNPKAARYAFSNAPDGNLFNKEGLPASSFTTEKLTN
jgi:sialate O-acetylesterase